MNIIVKNTKSRLWRRGFVALITVLIVVTVSLIVGTAMSFKAITQGNSILAEVQSTQAWSSVNGCVEKVLGDLGAGIATSTWNTILTTPGYNLAVGSTTCHVYQITATSSDYRLINASSTIASFTRKLQVVVATNTPSLNISTWQEVSDF